MPIPDNHLDDREAYAFLAQLFPGGLRDAGLMGELCPEGWDASPLRDCFHPGPERAYKEYLDGLENLRRFRAMGRKRNTTHGREADAPDEPERLPLTPDAFGAEWREREAARDPETDQSRLEEFAELFGLCLWDVFSDNHEVMADDGRIVDLGSFRGTAATIAEFFHTGTTDVRRVEAGDWTAFLREDYDYCRFYLGTLHVSGRADLSPVYQLIFDRLHSAGGDWRYSHPRLHMVSFRHSKADVLRADPELYDPSAVLAAEQEDVTHEEQVTRMRRDLDECYARSIREARQNPPPFTVAAYRAVFGRFPEGWPPPL